MNQNVCASKKDVRFATKVNRMNENLKTILESAIKDEEYFFNFYNMLADKSTKENIKEELGKLAMDEKRHKEKLESLSFEKIGAKVIARKIEAMDIARELEFAPIEDFKGVREMLVFAVKQEAMAQATYEKLKGAMEDENARNLFNMLAEEEKSHKLLLTGKLALIDQVGEINW